MRGNAWVAWLALSIGACGGGGAGAPPPDRTEGATTGEEEPPAMSALQELNARARAGAVTETLHGVEVSDPYRALESESPLTTEWIEAQTARTRDALATWSRPGMAEQIQRVLSIGTIGGGAVAGEWVLYSRRDPGREQPALFAQRLGRNGQPDGEARVLVDPLTYGERAALDWYYVSPRGRYVAFGISANGDERSTLRVVETATGTVLPDTIDHAKWSEVSWLHSEDGFYYRRYPREGEADWDPEAQDGYHIRLFFHALGSDTAADPLVFAPPEPTDFPSASVSDDDRWVVINTFRGWSQSDVHLFDRGRAARGRAIVPDEQHPLVPVVTGLDSLTSGRVHRGRLYLHTNIDAPRYRIAAVDPASAADRGAWREVVPQGPSAIEGWTIAGDRIALHVIDDVRSRVLVRRLSDGREDGEIELPGRGDVQSFDADPETGRLVVGFSAFAHAPAIHLWSARDRQLRPIAAVEVPVDLAQLEVTQERVPSRDGTPINVYLLHRRGLARDGSNPVLLNAYGGFNISLLPGFQRHPLYWVVERGGVFAVANLRGGGEFGEEWHRAGNLANKEHVFEDMEAVTRWLSSSGISRPERIAITGGSNGGLLMGAMITRAPDAFAAAASYVGLYDMIRYHRFPPAELWISEYGSSEDAAQFPWLWGYSPYHRVREGVRYPAILIETADHDTRVHWGHSTKFAARLQEATGEPDPRIWFYREALVGHGAGTRLSDLVARYQRMYAFVEHALGMSGVD